MGLRFQFYILIMRLLCAKLYKKIGGHILTSLVRLKLDLLYDKIKQMSTLRKPNNYNIYLVIYSFN